MKVVDRVKSISNYVTTRYRQGPSFDEYPTDILDLVIFHKIHFYMGEKDALQCYRRLKSSFVDWNEVRISSIREIQEVVANGADGLDISVFVKGLLEYLHQHHHSVDLEFLAERNLTEIRRFLKQIKGVDTTTINMILKVRKDYPVVPVNASMECTLERLGVVRSNDSRDQKAKYLHGLVSEELSIPFHHFFLNHSREVCPPDESEIKCGSCGIRASCDYYAKTKRRRTTRRKR